ncbi:armadillo-type protein [Melampsora americana]|nr:armadillo-type protein [Melampsora americana]
MALNPSHEELATILAQTLSNDNQLRSNAESKLGFLPQELPTFGILLAELIKNDSYDIALRQAASTNLRRYVLHHWSPFFASFVGSAPSVEIKCRIREIMSQTLGCATRKLRSTCALVISEIAHCDWPEEWPELVPMLIATINNPDKSDTTRYFKDGALRVLCELVRNDLTEQQLVPVAKDLIPCLFSVISASQDDSISDAAMKIRSLSIFRQCLVTLTLVKSSYPDLTSSITMELLPNWLHLFKLLLTTDAQALQAMVDRSELHLVQNLVGIKCEVMRTLDVILNGFYNSFRQAELLRNDSLSVFVELGFSTLNLFFPIYEKAVLSLEESPAWMLADGGSIEQQEDPIFQSNTILRLPATVINFLKNVLSKPISKKLFLNSNSPTSPDNLSPTPALEILVGFIFQYGQITRDEEESWKADENTFVIDYLDEDEDNAVQLGGTNRQAAVDLLETLIDVLDQPAVTAVMKHLPEMTKQASQMKSQGISHWWKSIESTLTVIGNLSGEFQGEGSVHYNINEFVEREVLSLLTCDDQPLLQGRGFVFISQFTKHLTQDKLQQVMLYCSNLFASSDASNNTDLDSGCTITTLCLIKALRNFARYSPSLLKPYSYAILDKLLRILPNAVDAISITIIETIHRVCEPVLDELEAEALYKLADCVLLHLSRNVSDHLLVDAMTDLFTMLSTSSSPLVMQALTQRVLPQLGKALTVTEVESPTDHFVIKASSVAVIDGIFKGKLMPLSGGMFEAVAPGLFVTLASSEDPDLIQDCLNILTSVVRKGTDQLINWRSPIDQKSGIDHLVSCLAHVLDPQRADSAGLFVGDLILHLLRKSMDSIVGVLPDLLKTLASRLATARTATFSQSMILPFAYLLHQHADTVLDLLESFHVTGINGQQQLALQLVLSTWCENADTFQGYWNIRVSTVALSQLYACTRPSLDQITVKGDLIITDKNVHTIMTRARAKANPDQFQAIPLRAKILKILVGELQSQLSEQAKVGVNEELDGLDDDDEDQDWEDDVVDLSSKSKREILQLSDMLGPSASYILTEDDENDKDVEDEADLKEDPFYNIDLLKHLQDFIQHVCSQDVEGFKQLSSQWLSAQELLVVQTILR